MRAAAAMTSTELATLPVIHADFPVESAMATPPPPLSGTIIATCSCDSARSKTLTASETVVTPTTCLAGFSFLTVSTRGNGSLLNFAKTSSARWVSALNSRVVKSAFALARSGFGGRAFRSTSIGTSRRNVISSRFRSARSRPSFNDAASFGVCSSAESKIACNDPYLAISFAAVFSPTP